MLCVLYVAQSHGTHLFLFLFRELGEVHLILGVLSPSTFLLDLYFF